MLARYNPWQEFNSLQGPDFSQTFKKSGSKTAKMYMRQAFQ